MAVSGSFGPLLTLAMTAVSIYGMVAGSRARKARRNSTAPNPQEAVDAERHRAARAETERRMAAYLASRPRVGEAEE